MFYYMFYTLAAICGFAASMSSANAAPRETPVNRAPYRQHVPEWFSFDREQKPRPTIPSETGVGHFASANPPPTEMNLSYHPTPRAYAYKTAPQVDNYPRQKFRGHAIESKPKAMFDLSTRLAATRGFQTIWEEKSPGASPNPVDAFHGNGVQWDVASLCFEQTLCLVGVTDFFAPTADYPTRGMRNYYATRRGGRLDFVLADDSFWSSHSYRMILGLGGGILELRSNREDDPVKGQEVSANALIEFLAWRHIGLSFLANGAAGVLNSSDSHKLFDEARTFTFTSSADEGPYITRVSYGLGLTLNI